MPQLYSKSGLLLAHAFLRVVHGGRGDYIELEHDQINWSAFYIPKDLSWRWQDPFWKERVYYVEWRSRCKSYVKLYEQKKLVDYANYKIGLFYISLQEIRDAI